MPTNKKTINVNNPTQINIEHPENGYQSLKNDVRNFDTTSFLSGAFDSILSGLLLFIRSSVVPAIVAILAFVGTMAWWHNQKLTMAYREMFKIFIFIVMKVIPFLFVKGFPFIIILGCCFLYAYLGINKMAKILYKNDVKKQKDYIKASSIIGSLLLFLNRR